MALKRSAVRLRYAPRTKNGLPGIGKAVFQFSAARPNRARRLAYGTCTARGRASVRSVASVRVKPRGGTAPEVGPDEARGPVCSPARRRAPRCAGRSTRHTARRGGRSRTPGRPSARGRRRRSRAASRRRSARRRGSGRSGWSLTKMLPRRKATFIPFVLMLRQTQHRVACGYRRMNGHRIVEIFPSIPEGDPVLRLSKDQGERFRMRTALVPTAPSLPCVSATTTRCSRLAAKTSNNCASGRSA